MAKFHIRIEMGGSNRIFVDTYVGADNIEQARERIEEKYAIFPKWDWHGAVAFVDGARPAEDAQLRDGGLR